MAHWKQLTVGGAIAVVTTMIGFALGQDTRTSIRAEPPEGQKEMDEDGEMGDEAVIKLEEAPQVVRDAIAKAAQGDEVTRVIQEKHEDQTSYEVELATKSGKASLRLSTLGEIIELEKSATVEALPGAARQALKDEYPGASLSNLSTVQLFFWEVDVKSGDDIAEIRVYADGRIEEIEEGD